MLIVKHIVDYWSNAAAWRCRMATPPGHAGRAVKCLCIAVVALALAGADARSDPLRDVPLPRPRPTDLQAPHATAPEDHKDGEEKPARDEDCL
jgi:hypothetical protein